MAKYKYFDVVKFNYFDGKDYYAKQGEVQIIDEQGYFGGDGTTSYDIFVEGEEYLYKHIPEKDIIELVSENREKYRKNREEFLENMKKEYKKHFGSSIDYCMDFDVYNFDKDPINSIMTACRLIDNMIRTNKDVFNYDFSKYIVNKDLVY